MSESSVENGHFSRIDRVRLAFERTFQGVCQKTSRITDRFNYTNLIPVLIIRYQLYQVQLHFLPYSIINNLLNILLILLPDTLYHSSNIIILSS